MHSSRRKFLRSSAVVGLAAGLSPLKSLAFSKEAAEDCPPKERSLVFLFQGDSITDGNRGRNSDPNHIMGHGYAFAVSSRIGADFPELDLNFFNRGISGNKVADLQKRWQSDTLDIRPDVLSILIGINDVGAVVANGSQAANVDDFEKVYRDLLQQSKNANADILFVLGIPFVYAVGKRMDNWDLWKSETGKRAEVVRRLAEEFNAVVVDYPAALDKAMERRQTNYWIWDGIHPTIFGHEIMARQWIKAVSKRLKFLKRYKYNP